MGLGEAIATDAGQFTTAYLSLLDMRVGSTPRVLMQSMPIPGQPRHQLSAFTLAGEEPSFGIGHTVVDGSSGIIERARLAADGGVQVTVDQLHSRLTTSIVRRNGAFIGTPVVRDVVQTSTILEGQVASDRLRAMTGFVATIALSRRLR